MLLLQLTTPVMARAAFTSQVTSRTVIKDSFSAMKEIQMNYSFTMGTDLCLWNLMNFQVRELLVTDVLSCLLASRQWMKNMFQQNSESCFAHCCPTKQAVAGICLVVLCQKIAGQSNPDVSKNAARKNSTDKILVIQKPARYSKTQGIKCAR